MFVIKADGRKEEFNKKKIIRTCLRAGVEKETAKQIAEYVAKQISEGDTTKKVYKLVLKELDKRELKKDKCKYHLREAIAQLAPDKFENFIKRVLEIHGYKCGWNKLINGESVTHQVDVVAELGGELYLVECKHHTNPHRMCGLGTVLQIWARWEDIANGFKKGINNHNFKNPWLINNTKFSNHAKKYAKAKGIKLSGWRHKGKESLECLVENKKAFPVTILKVDSNIKNKLMDRGMLTLLDILDLRQPKKILGNQVDAVLKQVNGLLNNKNLLKGDRV